MQLPSHYMMSAEEHIRRGLVHYELRDRQEDRAQAAVHLSTATEHLLREKLHRLGSGRHDDHIPYPRLVRLLTLKHVRSHERGTLTRFRKLRNAVLHDAATIDGERFAQFDALMPEVLRFLRRFLERELEVDTSELLGSYFPFLLQGEELDLHDRADLVSKAAVQDVHLTVRDENVEDSIRFANQAFDLALRALAHGVGLLVEGRSTREVIQLMRDQAPRSEAWYSYGDEFIEIHPDSFQRDGRYFSGVDEAEAYVSRLRHVVVDVLERARRPKWEVPIRHKWPEILAILEARSPGTRKLLPTDPQKVRVCGNHVHITATMGRSGLERHCQAILSVISQEIPDLPPVLTVKVGPIIG